MDIMTEDGWKQLKPKNCIPVNTGPREMKPWEEKYDRDHDPQFANAPKLRKFGQ